MQIKSLQNEGLKWERTSSWNVGLDFGFFNGRLNGAFAVSYTHLDVYKRQL